MKKLLVYVLVTAMTVLMTGCGVNNPDEEMKSNNTQLDIQSEEAQDESMYEEEINDFEIHDMNEGYNTENSTEVTEEDMGETICAFIMEQLLLNEGMDDEFTKEAMDETVSWLAEEFSIDEERVLELYNKYRAAYEDQYAGDAWASVSMVDIPASDTIINAPMDEMKIIQIGSVIIDEKMTLGEIAALLNAKDADKNEIKDRLTTASGFAGSDSYAIDEDDMDTLSEKGYVLLKTEEGIYVSFRSSKGENLASLREGTVTTVYIVDSNIYLPGGVHVGMSYEEMSSLLENAGIETMNTKKSNGHLDVSWVSRESTRNTAHRIYAHINKETHEIEGLSLAFDWRE